MIVRRKSKKISWYKLLIIYCLENGKNNLSEEYIARSVNIPLNEYKNILRILKSSGIYDLVEKYVSENLFIV